MNFTAICYYYFSLNEMYDRFNNNVWFKHIEKRWNKNYDEIRSILETLELKGFIKRKGRQFQFLKHLNENEEMLALLYQNTMENNKTNLDKIDAVHEFVKKTGLDYTSTAKILGISKSTISQWKIRSGVLDSTGEDFDEIKNNIIKLQQENKRLSVENWDLHLKINSKEAELIEERNRKALANFEELQNARRQVEHLIDLNVELEKKLSETTRT
jgi:predicted transcriptional regulator